MVCRDPADTSDRYREAPCLIAEVLSPSTAHVDRREKLHTYLKLPSLLTYLLIDPDKPMVEAHTRASATSPWKVEYHGVEGTIFLACPRCDLDVGDLYRA